MKVGRQRIRLDSTLKACTTQLGSTAAIKKFCAKISKARFHDIDISLFLKDVRGTMANGSGSVMVYPPFNQYRNEICDWCLNRLDENLVCRTTV